MSAPYGPERLLTELSAQVTPDGVKLAWKVDEARAHRITVIYSAAAAGNSLQYADGTAIEDFTDTLTTTARN